MSDPDPLEDRLRKELHALDEPRVDVGHVLAAGRRRARRRAVRRAAVASTGVAAVVAGIGLAVIPDDAPDTVTDTPPQTPTTSMPPAVTPQGEDTTWPGGPFDPIEGMVAVPGATRLSDGEAAVVHDAEVRLTRACMARHGYEWGTNLGDGPGNPPLYLSPDELRVDGYRYDWAAAGEAFLGGGGGAAPETAGMTDEELDAYTAALGGTAEPDVWIDTHDGRVATSNDGCTGEARAQLYGTVANALRYDTLHEALGDVSDQLQHHPEYRRPLAAWQACMGEAGFDVGDHDYGASYILQAGAAALSERGRGQTQFTAETIPAISDADADCQESSGLYEVRRALLPTIHEEMADDLGVDLAHYVAYERALYARAQQVP